VSRGARVLILFAALLAPLLAAAGSLHEEPVGTPGRGDFALGLKRVHAPPGEWTLVARSTWTGTTNHVRQGTNFAGVYVAQIDDGRFVRAIQAWTNIDPNLTRGWMHNVDPCKHREKVLAYRDLSQSAENLFCFDVSELRGYMKKSTGWRQQAQEWLQSEKIKLPPNVLVVRFARLERAYWTEIFYYFDPREFSGASLAQQAQAAEQWADELAPVIRAGIEIRGP
jgi:hypothetical protein